MLFVGVVIIVVNFIVSSLLLMLLGMLNSGR